MRRPRPVHGRARPPTTESIPPDPRPESFGSTPSAAPPRPALSFNDHPRTEGRCRWSQPDRDAFSDPASLALRTRQLFGQVPPERTRALTGTVRTGGADDRLKTPCYPLMVGGEISRALPLLARPRRRRLRNVGYQERHDRRHRRKVTVRPWRTSKSDMAKRTAWKVRISASTREGQSADCRSLR